MATRDFYVPRGVARQANRQAALEAVMASCSATERLAGSDKVGPLRAEAESLLEEAALIDSYSDEEWERRVIKRRFFLPAKNRNLR